MSKKRVLYITTQNATVYAVAAAKLIEEEEFTATDEGLDRFSRYLQREQDALFYLLGDVPEEDFQQENIPYVTGPDRSALIARKLGQIFRDTKLSLAMSLGRETGTRRDERVLFAAFTNTQFFLPWLRALHGQEIRLAGVYSIALTANALIRKLGLKDEKLLVISVHRGGIRQNYFEDGKIRFSRLTPTVETDARRSAQACVAESGKILQYLEGLRLVPREGPPLKVMVFAPHDQFGVFSEVCTGGQRVQFEVIDEQVVASKIGLRSIPGGSRAEALFCFLLGQRAPAEQYASKVQRRMYRLWQMRQGILAASAALFAGSVLFAGLQFFSIIDLHSRAEDATRLAREDGQRYEDVRKTFPAMPTSTENLKAAVLRFDEIEHQNATPEPLLAEVSGVLNNFPSIEIDSIDWAVTRNPGDVGVRDSGRNAPAPVAQPAVAPGLGLPAQQNKTMFQAAYVTGRIVLPNRSDYRGVQDYLDSFAEALRKMPNAKVDLVKLPFDTRSNAKLTFVTSEQQTKAPSFALRITRKL
jgi:hypothetical protein